MSKRLRNSQRAEKDAQRVTKQAKLGNDTDLNKAYENMAKSTTSDKEVAGLGQKLVNEFQMKNRGSNGGAGNLTAYNTMNLQRDAALAGARDDIQEEQVEETQHENQEKQAPGWIAQARPEPKPGQSSGKKEEKEHTFSSPFDTNMLKTHPEPK